MFKMSAMEHYYPLELTVKVKHNYCGFIPSRNFKKWKRNLLKNCLVTDRIFEEKRRFRLEDILAKIYRNLNKYMNYFCHGGAPDIICFLCKIVPMEYFGSNLNRKRFLYIVRRILTQTRGECIHMCVLFEKFQYSGIPWLDTKQNVENQVLQANILLLQTVVKPYVRYYYHFLNIYRNREYQILPKGKVDSFSDRNIARTIKLHRMEKVKAPFKQLPISGKLRFIPKRLISHLDNRPIVHSYFKNKSVLNAIRNNLKCLIATFQIGSESNLYEKWKTFVEGNKSRKKLYAVKLDLLDAFGMVDVDELKSIITIDEKFLTVGQKQFLFETIAHQYIHVRGKKQVYKWNHGLLQGTKLSPTLCELYLSYITYKRFKMFNKSNCFMHRTVDDMFFVSTCESQVVEFELAAFGMSILNEEKTQKFLNTGENPHIVFCGKMFNLVSREICTAYEFPQGKELRSKFKFWNRKCQFSKDHAYEFIVNSVKFAYANFYFSRYELNTTCNTAKTVLKNIYDGMCFLGFKLFFAVESIEYLFQNSTDRCKTVLRSIDFILSSYPPVIHKIIKTYKGDHYLNIFSYNLITFLCLKAFIVVLQKRHFKYKEVIADMKDRTKRMSIPNFKENVDIKYFSKLPMPFLNISMRRGMSLDKSC